MITATFKKKNNQFVGYEIKGHASYAPEGQDIVCAAVSALSIAVTHKILANVQSLERITRGYMDIELFEPTQETEISIAILYEGINSIAEEYPKNLRVEVIQDVEEII